MSTVQIRCPVSKYMHGIAGAVLVVVVVVLVMNGWGQAAQI